MFNLQVLRMFNIGFLFLHGKYLSRNRAHCKSMNFTKACAPKHLCHQKRSFVDLQDEVSVMLLSTPNPSSHSLIIEISNTILKTNTIDKSVESFCSLYCVITVQLLYSRTVQHSSAQLYLRVTYSFHEVRYQDVFSSLGQMHILHLFEQLSLNQPLFSSHPVSISEGQGSPSYAIY